MQVFKDQISMRGGFIRSLPLYHTHSTLAARKNLVLKERECKNGIIVALCVILLFVQAATDRLHAIHNTDDHLKNVGTPWPGVMLLW